MNNTYQMRALRVPCHTCGATIGTPCHAHAYPDRPVAPHLVRVDDATPLHQSGADLLAALQKARAAANNPRRSERNRDHSARLLVIYDDELLHRLEQVTP